MQPVFFTSAETFREWLEAHHEHEEELIVGFWKKGSGRPSMTWPESVDQALCFGWIDGIRRRIDDESYSIRFTPRRKGSIWSAINIRRVEELKRLGGMRPAGLRAFERRIAEKSAVYSYEKRTPSLQPAGEKRFRRNRRAWAYFESQPPGYRRLAIHWVTSAKREETRARRLATLIDDSANGKRIDAYTLAPKKKA